MKKINLKYLSNKAFGILILLLFNFYFASAQIIDGQSPAEQPIMDTYEPMDHNLIMNMAAERQRQQAIKYQRMKEEAAVKIDQTKRIYSSVTKYPLTISDGWQNVVVTDNLYYCFDLKVLVIDNKITRIDFKGKKISLSFSSSINQAKAYIKFKFENGTESPYFDVYFIEYLLSK